MGRLIKILVSIVGLMLLLGVIGVVIVLLFFDVNDYRNEIEQAVEENTGRDFVIDGDIGLSVFPWVKIEMPPVSLGNAAGFGHAPMLRIEQADLSLKLLPLLLRREVEVSTARLKSLDLNLAVNGDGRGNWQDFVDAAEYKASLPEEAAATNGSSLGSLQIAGIEILDSVIRYADAQAGTDIALTDLNIEVGDISDTADTIMLDGVSIGALIEGLSTTPTVFALQTASVNISTDAQTVSLDPVDLELLGLDIAATLEPVSYANEITPTAAIEVQAFSLRNLMERLDIEAPATSDPAALGKVTIRASAKMGATAISLTDLELVLDDTSFTGSLSIPQGDNDVFELELHGDSIILDGYMAPVAPVGGPSGPNAAEAAPAAPTEIPVELIRLLNARGDLTLASAELSGMRFEDLELGVVMDDGKLRMHPVKASLFDGKYNGDVRIDASGNTPVLSVNEHIEGVQLGALAKAMFEQDNMTGTINGNFELSGRGADLGTIQRDLDGHISMELVDGAFEGTDVWYELRKARAAIRREEPPQPTLPARTRFSEVSASGPVSNGVLSNNDLIAELPFMQLTGNGSVNFAEGTVDYRMTARVFEKPELIGGDVTAEELEDLSKTQIPIRITGPVTDPSVKPDVEKLLQDRVKKEVEDKLKDKLKDLLNH